MILGKGNMAHLMRCPMDMDRFLNWQNIERYKKLSDIATDETQRRPIFGLLSEESKQLALQERTLEALPSRPKIHRSVEATSDPS
jgi:hypothetical protein